MVGREHADTGSLGGWGWALGNREGKEEPERVGDDPDDTGLHGPQLLAHYIQSQPTVIFTN